MASQTTGAKRALNVMWVRALYLTEAAEAEAHGTRTELGGTGGGAGSSLFLRSRPPQQVLQGLARPGNQGAPSKFGRSLRSPSRHLRPHTDSGRSAPDAGVRPGIQGLTGSQAPFSLPSLLFRISLRFYFKRLVAPP